MFIVHNVSSTSINNSLTASSGKVCDWCFLCLKRMSNSYLQVLTKLYQHRSNKDIRKNFFTNRIINIWNSLPENVISAKNTKIFEHRLDNYWKDHLYGFQTELAYSRWGRTSALYNIRKVGVSIYVKVRRICPIILFDLFIFSFIWSSVAC
jgi:hypothetical protein